MNGAKIILCMALIFFVTVTSGCGKAIKGASNLVKSKAGQQVAEEVVERAFDVASNTPVNNRPSASANNRSGARSSAKIAAVAATGSIVTNELLSTDRHWIRDLNQGAYLWNPEPQDGESVRWSGGVVREGENLYAQGPGTLTWYKDGQVIQTDEGSFERGKHHGQFKHTFKSGNVDYSNWDHGVEIAVQNSGGDDLSVAKQTFLNYHRAITNGNYREAYDILSNSQKQRVGDFNSYVGGFVNTISSEVSDIRLISSNEDSYTFDYTLTARDRYRGNGVKVMTFKGQVTMAKDKGRWYVRYAKSDKVNERYE